VTRARPREGLRLVWMPKEDADLDFSDNNWLLAYNNVAVVNGLIT
jgi:nitrate reductase alpha subunit